MAEKAASRQPADEGVFIEVDEDDPFVALQMVAMLEDGSNMVVGGLEVDSGRYELVKMEDTDGE